MSSWSWCLASRWHWLLTHRILRLLSHRVLGLLVVLNRLSHLWLLGVLSILWHWLSHNHHWFKSVIA